MMISARSLPGLSLCLECVSLSARGVTRRRQRDSLLLFTKKTGRGDKFCLLGFLFVPVSFNCICLVFPFLFTVYLPLFSSIDVNELFSFLYFVFVFFNLFYFLFPN